MQKWQRATSRRSKDRADDRARLMQAAAAGDDDAQTRVESVLSKQRTRNAEKRLHDAVNAILEETTALLERVLLTRPHRDDGFRPHERPVDALYQDFDCAEEVCSYTRDSMLDATCHAD